MLAFSLAPARAELRDMFASLPGLVITCHEHTSPGIERLHCKCTVSPPRLPDEALGPWLEGTLWAVDCEPTCVSDRSWALKFWHAMSNPTAAGRAFGKAGQGGVPLPLRQMDDEDRKRHLLSGHLLGRLVNTCPCPILTSDADLNQAVPVVSAECGVQQAGLGALGL